MPQSITETAARAPLTPVSSGYADVNRIKLYHEIYGQGEPLVLLHGGLMTIGEMSTLLEPFAKTRKVIAVELQGHGRTTDTDRSLSFETMGDDIAALLNQLNISKAESSAYRSVRPSACAPPSSIRKRFAGSSSSPALTPRVAGTPKRSKAWAGSAPPWPKT